MDRLDIGLIVVGLAYLLYRRVVGDLVQVEGLLVLPLVLTAVGVAHVHDERVGVGTLVLLAAGAVVSLVYGAVRGVTVHLGVRDGEPWMRHRDGAVVWARGRDGAPHRTSPTFDRFREQVRAGDAALLRTVVSTTQRDR